MPAWQEGTIQQFADAVLAGTVQVGTAIKFISCQHGKRHELARFYGLTSQQLVYDRDHGRGRIPIDEISSIFWEIQN